jgi:hypothetical protein
MRVPFCALALVMVAVPLRADPARVTVVMKDGRHGGTLSVSQVEMQSGPRSAKIPIGEIGAIQFGDIDVIQTRSGKRVKGTVRVDGWALKEGDADLPTGARRPAIPRRASAAGTFEARPDRRRRGGERHDLPRPRPAEV